MKILIFLSLILFTLIITAIILSPILILKKLNNKNNNNTTKEIYKILKKYNYNKISIINFINSNYYITYLIENNNQIIETKLIKYYNEYLKNKRS
ncbi:MAG: hypothetical protein PWP46_456 [Fusobacteriaceae bacterium]|jgi:hypothetical protein|nr:hypothetical protein [Fusobacteriaceae bacterium]